MKQNHMEHVLLRKILFSCMILCIYIAGRWVPLYNIDTSAYQQIALNSDNIFLNITGNAASRYSIFILGLSPFVWSSMIVQIINVFKGSDRRKRTTQKKNEQMIRWVALIMAAILAIFQVGSLHIVENDIPVLTTFINIGLMTGGAMVIVLLCELNKKYGIGGQTLLIIVNIVESLVLIVESVAVSDLIIPLIIGAGCIAVGVFMENKEIRTRVLHVSIHNVYAEDSYFAIKLNPIGVMPIVFASSAFMLPQLIVQMLAYQMPDNELFASWNDHLVLTDPVGLIVYIAIIYILTFVFAFVFLRPDEIAKNYREMGDCLEGIRIGKPTRRYIEKRLFRLCLLSATVMSACVGVPMILQFVTDINSQLLMLPSTLLIVTCMISTVVREIISVHSFDKYKQFI